jgi:two-component system, chemotaxis family, CheB/CheR fusion protein
MTTTPSARDLEVLLDYLRRSRGFDFTGYKRPSLTRRITKRMQAIGAQSYDEYIDRLEVQPDEFEHLFNTILINVTSFFRDPDAWDFLGTHVIPRLLESKAPDEPIRLWSAGCASGAEAYSLAILFAEALPPERFRERVKVYATDVDDEALAYARQACYSLKEVEGVRPDLLERHFEHTGGRYCFRKDLRRCVIFGRNDLVQDAPISRIDLLACRNTLMYFDAATQARIVSRFHFALNEGAYLFLGRAETMLSHAGTFVPVDLRRRIFTKVHRPGGREQVLLGRYLGEPHSSDGINASPSDAAFHAGPVAQLVTDRDGRLALVNERARALFQLAPTDIGRALRDLEISYRPFELRSLIDQAQRERRTVTMKDAPWHSDSAGPRWFDVQVVPLEVVEGEAAGVSVSFAEVTAYREIQIKVEHARQELEAAYEELQSTNEELETTNEELHSTVEELETTNEELQSTNEELETMNEELHSTNEELQAINDELRRQSDQLNEANDFQDRIFTSLRAGIAVLDQDLRVMVWNARAEGLWGARADEVRGLSFPDLDIGLPVSELVQPLRAALDGQPPEREMTLVAVNRRGRPIHCRVTLLPLIGRTEAAPRGVMVLMADETGMSSGAAARRRSGA